ncbi:PhnD/SsuA/transferrin family substrate-binding protein [Microbacterium esteraromaticum]|uniref:PhnD/SsuA/transferrin family substrate-binding protein n=1 Tax=Microbacterium esteraromaticum TaxID=57043 RepID=UPI002367ED86|nr:PhnD/SsuA/transferrin family substrate-binding protein [Microbacterium esteraromaticum]WDH77487.1 PhnD/SsuA/transferrin family substrate-binding protein [Microbacterium esteraromaticum]
MRSRTSRALGTLAIGVVALTGCSGGASAEGASDPAPSTIRMVTLPLVDDPNAVTPVDALKNLLGEATGLDVEITDVPSYSAAIEAVRAGHSDIVMASGFPAALAVNTGEVDPLVAWPGADDPVSTCLVLDDSELHDLNDITVDTVVVFADPASSSGYFMPVHMLDAAGLTKDEDYTSMMSGGHDRSLLALQQGQADVACTSTLFPPMAGQGSPLFPFEVGETRSIGESIPMPVAMTLLGSQSMAPEKRAALLDAIPVVYDLDNADELGLYAEGIPEGIEPIVEPATDLFQPFVDIAAVAGVDISDLD